MKTALVTGANRGIGFEIVRELALKEFSVFLSARNSEKGIKAAESLKNKGLNVDFLEMDVSDKKSIEHAADEFKSKSGSLEVLVNNAAILIDDGDILNLDPGILMKTLTINTTGSFLVINAFLPFMEKGARIINISSDSGSLHLMRSKSPAYSISKTALNAVTRQFAKGKALRLILFTRAGLEQEWVE